MITMHCHRSLIRIRVPIGQLPRTLIPGCLVVVALLSPLGCVQQPDSTTGTIEIDLAPGETAGGYMFAGQGLRATALVEAGHLYNISVVLSDVSAGLGETVGVVSGVPLAEPVEFSLQSSSGGSVESPEPHSVLVPHVDGDVAVEFVFVPADVAEPADPVLEALRDLVSGGTRASYEILLTDLGFDDNGTSPEDAVALAVGMEGELTGTINPGEDADYFVLQVQIDATYELKLESTHSITVTSGSQDRFGQINFGAATAGGLLISGSSSAGNPGITQFTAAAIEPVLLRLAAGGSDASSAATIQYAISVVEVVPEEEEEEVASEQPESRTNGG